MLRHAHIEQHSLAGRVVDVRVDAVARHLDNVSRSGEPAVHPILEHVAGHIGVERWRVARGRADPSVLVQGDHVHAGAIVELVDLADTIGVELPAQAFDEHAAAKLVHLIEK